jgi:hypothetical protein
MTAPQVATRIVAILEILLAPLLAVAVAWVLIFYT